MKRTGSMLGTACLIVGTLAVYSEDAKGQQLSFDTRRQGSQTIFNYVFRPRSQERIAFGFALPNVALDQAVSAFRRIEPSDMRRRFRKENRRLLDAEVARLRARYPQATIQRRGNGVAWSISPDSFNQGLRQSRDQLLRQELDALRRQYPNSEITQEGSGQISIRGPSFEMGRLGPALRQALKRVEDFQDRQLESYRRNAENQMRSVRAELQQAVASMDRRLEEFERTYYAERAYTLTGNTIKPDYAAIARRSAPDLRPLAAAWSQVTDGQPMLGVINRLLGFFQTIPYDQLTSRLTSNGAGFAFPLALLARNRGDCDTKSVAFAAVLHQLYPKMPIVMVLVPEHALIGLGIPPRQGDHAITAGGRTYVLVEPVGPRLSVVGEIGKDTRGRLAKAEILPLF